MSVLRPSVDGQIVISARIRQDASAQTRENLWRLGKRANRIARRRTRRIIYGRTQNEKIPARAGPTIQMYRRTSSRKSRTEPRPRISLGSLPLDRADDSATRKRGALSAICWRAVDFLS